MTKPKIKNGFDPIWKEDFDDLILENLSPTAFIIRQLLRIYRNIDSCEVILSDLKIQSLTGFSRPTISKAKKQLLDLGYIKKVGYHKYFIRKFERN